MDTLQHSILIRQQVSYEFPSLEEQWKPVEEVLQELFDIDHANVAPENLRVSSTLLYMGAYT